MDELGLTRETLEKIDAHAVESYPEECCGAIVILGGVEHVRRITNIQNRLHRENPVEHPRDARTAYFMEPKELLGVLNEVEAGKGSIAAFYHSHPEHGAYFSAEDEARAMAWDEPAYPGACYVVVSVIFGKVRDRRAVAWDPTARRFTKIELAVR